MAGVMGACALGTGLGMWARPTSPNAAPAAIARQAPVPPRPSLQIVVDDTPAPVGRPMEVLPADLAPVEGSAPMPPPEMVAPRRAASGLVKVDTTVAPQPPLLAPAAKAEPRPTPRMDPRPDADVAKAKLAKARVETMRLEKAKVEQAKVEKAKAEKARLETSRTEHARTDKARADKARSEQARIAEAKAKKAQQLADARAEAADRAHAQKLAQADKAKAVKLAKLEAKRETTAKADAKARKLATLAKAAKAASQKLEAEAKALTRRKAIQIAEANRKARMAQPPRTVVAARKPVPRGEGPMRVARANTCASPDPGEAMVCADRRLGARDRQLQQAYRNAEAAGVPASALNRQQARWLQARAAAAREAPWAVEDVYVARISELNDLSRDAREN